jgi:hypothetical protein
LISAASFRGFRRSYSSNIHGQIISPGKCTGLFGDYVNSG